MKFPLPKSIHLQLAAVVLICACNQILGVTELSNATLAEPDAGGADAGRRAGSAGVNGVAGSAGEAVAGRAGDEAGRGTAGEAGRAGSGGSARPEAGRGGTSPAPDAGPISARPEPGRTVRGKVIDFWRKPVAAVSVSSGSNMARSDERGEFSLDVSSDDYDLLVSYVVTFVNGNTRSYRHLFQGLTRGDPTLQVDLIPSAHTSTIQAAVSGVMFPLTDTQRVEVSFGSPNLSWSFVPDQSTKTTSEIWFGPSRLDGTLHVLSWTSDASGLPVGYLGHTAQSLTMNDGALTMVDARVGSQAIETATIAGHVAVSGSRVNRENRVYVYWPDYARSTIVTHSAAPDDFSYSVPKLAGSKIMVAARTGDPDNGPYAAVHRANLDPGQSALDLALPAFPATVAPANNASAVGPDTRFEWSGEPAVHVLYVINGTTEALRVITASTHASMPRTASGEFNYDRAEQYGFWVETYGPYASVDEATGPDGFLDDFASGVGDQEDPAGVPRDSGSFAASAVRFLKLAP